MLEYPEVLHIAQQLQENIVNKTIRQVYPPTKSHKFCWFNGNPSDYNHLLQGCKVTNINGFGIFVDILFDNGQKLCFNDGVNVRFTTQIPKDFQLQIEFDDHTSLVFTVAMYGGIVLHDENYDNEYYVKSKHSLSPFSEEFKTLFMQKMETSKPSLSTKAFLATEQRFPGIGNGVLQDILFNASIHPKRKIISLTNAEKEILLEKTVQTLKEMTAQGGRNTEKDIFGNNGNYKTILSKNTLIEPCPRCGHSLKKEAYLGGAVYYCPNCQK